MPCLWRATVGKDHAVQLTLEAATSDAETKSKEKIQAEPKLQQPNTGIVAKLIPTKVKASQQFSMQIDARRKEYQ